MTEELLNVLAKIPKLKVAARTSVFEFKGKGGDVREIGRKLGVSHIVEGSIRRDGEQVRVTAQLIRVADGFHLWSETYDRELESVFALQDEIAKRSRPAAQTSSALLRRRRRARDRSRRLRRIPQGQRFTAGPQRPPGRRSRTSRPPSRRRLSSRRAGPRCR